ncbi:LysR family transcriptional regulator [Marinospirillum sp.]|uniref:LysR family transcriptional regulator n=1 Tax=Marinospirillum sp. TaxID=2183934 RepID=UPI003A83D8A2
MRPNQAEILLTVLDEGSIAAAARRLNRSRTTVSTALSALEDELDAQLFERTGKELYPTPLAWAIQPDCLRYLQTYRQIAARCEQERQGVEVALRLARDDALPEAFWRATIRELKKRFPLTGVAVYLAPPQELADLVETQAVDLAFGLTSRYLEQDYEQLHFQELGSLRQLIVSAPDHPLCRLPLVRHEDLEVHTQITMAFMEEDELVPEQAVSANYLAMTQFELMRDAILEGTGWGRLPLPVIAQALKEERLRQLRAPDAVTWQAYYRLNIRGQGQGQVANWLASQVRSYLKPFANTQERPLLP